MNRKLLISILVLGMAFCLYACGDTGDTSVDGGSSNQPSTESVADSKESASTEASSKEESSEAEESSESTESAESAESSEPDESSEPTETSDPTESSEPDESSEPTETSDPMESSEPTESSVPTEETQGTEDDPYLEFPESDMTLTTVSVPAGKSVFYAIYRVGGMIFTIDDADAYVIYEGERYEAVNGVVSFQVENALASEAIVFEIGNAGSKAESFQLVFTNPKGSYQNPTVLETLDGDITVSLPEGHDTGYYYRYIAEKAGTVRFYMTATTDSVMLVTNNRNSAQRSTETDGLTDETGVAYLEIEVLEGDEIIINVGAKPNRRGKYPATDITWNGKYN